MRTRFSGKHDVSSILYVAQNVVRSRCEIKKQRYGRCDTVVTF